MKSNTLKRKFTFVLCLLLVSCVTINIYFPAAAVEKAADRIVEEVWGEKVKKKMEEEKKEEKKEQSPQGFLEEFYRNNISGIFVSVANAQEADINVTTPAIRALKASIKRRASRLIPYLDKGNVGLTNDGLLAIRSIKGLTLKQRAELKRLVKAENADRNALYLEIANANNISPDRVDDIKRIFAKSWIKKAKRGWWIQDKKGAWHRKK